LLARHRREAGQDRRPLADLGEESGPGPFADVGADFEVAEGASALGVDDALGYALAVERLHLLDDVVIVQDDRPVGPHRERMFVAGRGNARIGRGRLRGLLWRSILRSVVVHLILHSRRRAVQPSCHKSGARERGGIAGERGGIAGTRGGIADGAAVRPAGVSGAVVSFTPVTAANAPGARAVQTAEHGMRAKVDHSR